jgi:cell division protein FtsQ
VTPTNRRIRKAKPAPDVMELSPDSESLEAEGAPPLEDGEELAPPPPPPRVESRFLRVLRHVGGVTLVVCVSVAVAWAARRYVTQSPRFAVSEIEVTGQKFRTAELLAEEAGVSKGKNVFSVDLEDARVKLSKDPWIREASLSRRLPGTLSIKVVEREAVALVSLGELYLSTRDGEMFKRLETGDPTDFPIITGISADALADDREGVAQSIRRALDLAGDYEHGPLGQKARLQEIHLAKDGTTTLIVGKNGLQLALGDPPFRKKLDQAARVLAELDKRGAKADAIMLDNDARPERVVVRVR